MSRMRDRVEKAKKKLAAARPRKISVSFRQPDGSLTPLDAPAEFNAQDRVRWQMPSKGPALPDHARHDDTPREVSLPQRDDGKCCSHCGLPFPIGPTLVCSCTPVVGGDHGEIMQRSFSTNEEREMR